MAAVSPSPSSSPSPVPPASVPPPSSPPPLQQNTTSPPTNNPPQAPQTNVTAPSPAKPLSSPPPTLSSPPSPSPPPVVPPPTSQSPPSSGTPPSSPPPSTNPPTSSPPPPSTDPPPKSPRSSPPPLRSRNGPPPPSTFPPQHSPVPPSAQSNNTSPRQPATSPQNSPPAQSGPPNAPSPVSVPSSGSPPESSLPSTSASPPPGISVPSLPSASGNQNNNTSGTGNSSTSRSSGGGGIGTGGTVAIGLIFGILLLASVGISAWCICQRKKKGPRSNGGLILPTSVGSSPGSDSAFLKVGLSAANIRSGSGNSRSWFTFEELIEATDGFASQNLLGEGGFGSVYKGNLVDGREVAVKQLKIGGSQGEREFRAEVEIISRVHHRHLVSLVGYCISENRRMLVYDYVPNDTLYFHLHGDGRPVMDWTRRLKIAVGAARGIAYLHEDCHPRIIHRDIKSSNILLDDNFEARVSDFGLAKLFQDSNTHITTRVMGTFGYVAPEYASSGKLTEKSDVFSFGVVLLELITGRKSVDESQPPGEESLVEWARPLLSRALESQQFEELVDPRLQKNYVASEMFRMIETAAACVRHSSIKRPQMGQVVRAFESMVTSDLNNGMRVGESEIVNTAQQSEEIRLFRRMAFGIQDFSTGFFDQDRHTSSH